MLAAVNVLELTRGAAAFLVVACLWAMGMTVWSLHRRRVARSVRKRLDLSADPPATRQLRLWHDGQESTTTVPDEPARPLIRRLDQLLEQAGIATSAPACLVLTAAVSGAVGVVIAMLAGSPPIGLLAAAATVTVFWLYLQRRIARRRSQFERQLVDALELAARSLRVGHPLTASFRLIAEEVPAPVGHLFARICQYQALGESMEESLRRVAAESGSSDLKLFATSVVIQLRSGGNLAEMMVMLAAIIRERIRLNRRVRVLTAQVQLSKRVLLALPFLLFVVMAILNPRYMRPLYTTPTGRLLMLFGAAGLLLGAWSMNRLARVKY